MKSITSAEQSENTLNIERIELGQFSYSSTPGWVSFLSNSVHERESMKSEILTRIPSSQIEMHMTFGIEIPIQELEILISSGWRPRPRHTIEGQLLKDVKDRRQHRKSLFEETEEMEVEKITNRLSNFQLKRAANRFPIQKPI